VYFERTYYLGPDKGGAKPYGLLVEAMEKSDLWALARYAARGKDYLVLLRPAAGRIVMQQLYHSDEVRPVDEVPAETRKHSPNELKLATQLIGQIAAQTFEPEKYEDEVRKRIAKLVQDKVKGKDIVEGAPAEKKQRGEVIDLMDALKASLGAGRRTSARKPAAAKATRTRTKTRRAGRAARRSRP
jgi:DNA end-binding protein Ku